MSQPAGAPRRLRLGAVLLPLGMLLGCASALGAQLAAGVPQQPLSRLVWSSDAPLPSRFISAHGRRAALFGYSENGLEAWAYPLQILNGYRVSFRQQGAATEIEGQAVLRRITYSPQAVTRTYVGLNGVAELIPTMQEWKKAGRIRYIGATTSRVGQHAQMLQVMHNYPLDFIQVDYSIANRDAAEAILPFAEERRIGVLANLPFGHATLLRQAADRKLPPWAA
ncbi:MAG: hypothetical protein E6K31_02125, partial [Gammaproteobacteria bacterium]